MAKITANCKSIDELGEEPGRIVRSCNHQIYLVTDNQTMRYVNLKTGYLTRCVKVYKVYPKGFVFKLEQE